MNLFALGVIVVTNNLVTALQTCLRLGGVNVRVTDRYLIFEIELQSFSQLLIHIPNL